MQLSSVPPPSPPPTPGLRILIVEDDPLLGTHLGDQLQMRGYQPRLCVTPAAARQWLAAEPVELVLLDILLPGGNGLELLRELRQRSGVPVILISALGSESDRIQGFRSGADDYLPKPFSLDELQVRIEALCRRIAFERSLGEPPEPLASEIPLAFAARQQDVRHRDRWLGLTASEYRVLQLLWRQAGTVLSKPLIHHQALQRAWSRHDRSLDMHVSHLRRKLQQAGCAAVEIRTVWGQGYVLLAEA
ncbi:MAG: response regulator transcription factor [Pseudomonas oryzihabitans]